ncbi:MAG: sel1 repeat family protein [Myxococcota bacterium]|nr:sel1 repeat family protein [Myxococcota bacterium]
MSDACEGGVLIACVFGMRWLSDPLHAREIPDAGVLRAQFEVHHACLTGGAEACYRLGLLRYFGRGAFARDRARAATAYARGCTLGDSRACNNLGDALAYGDGTERDLARATAMFDKACRLGEALGCANLGYMAEHGRGVAKDRRRARALYRDSCASGDVYGCLHQTMLAAEDAGAPRDPERALEHWRSACTGRDARACAFLGVMYEDGVDGLTRDDARSLLAMRRGCELGEPRACEWVKAHSTD